MDLTPGVDGEEWGDLLDAIIRELPAVDRLRFDAPIANAAGGQGLLLDSLVDVLIRRGVDVERRYLD